LQLTKFLYRKAIKLHNRLRGPRRYRYLFRSIREIKPKCILELGTWNGTRAVQMILEARKFNSAEEIAYYGFDLFEEMTERILQEETSKWPPSFREVEERLLKTGVKISLYKGDTRESLPRMISQLPKMDFIFVDGGHSVETISSDWLCVQQLMHRNTTVIFDDYWNRDDAGAKPVLENIDKERFHVDILPVQDRFEKESGILKIKFARVRLRSE